MIPPDDPCSYKMTGVFSKMHGHQSHLSSRVNTSWIRYMLNVDYVFTCTSPPVVCGFWFWLPYNGCMETINTGPGDPTT